MAWYRISEELRRHSAVLKFVIETVRLRDRHPIVSGIRENQSWRRDFVGISDG